jgi:hypothetical protein
MQLLHGVSSLESIFSDNFLGLARLLRATVAFRFVAVLAGVCFANFAFNFVVAESCFSTSAALYGDEVTTPADSHFRFLVRGVFILGRGDSCLKTCYTIEQISRIIMIK